MTASEPLGDPRDPPIAFVEPKSLTEAATRSVFWSASQKWGSEILETVVFMVLARLVLPEAFGLVTMARVFVSLVQLFLDQGLESAIVQRKDLRRSHLDTALWTTFGLGVVFAAAGFLMAGPIADWMLAQEDAAAANPAELAGILRLLSLTFVVGGLAGVPSALLRRRLEFRDLALRNWIATGVSGVTGITLALLGFGAWSLAWMQVAAVVAGVPVLWLRCGHRPGFTLRRAAFRDLFGYGSSILGYRLVSCVGEQADRVIIARALGAAQLGFYALAQRVLMSLSRVFGQTLGHVILPVFARVQDDPERFRRSYVSTVRLLSIVTVPAYLGVLAVAGDVIVVAFGERWTPATGALRILLVVGFLQTLILVNTLVLMAIGQPGKTLVLNTVATAVRIAALLLFGARGIEIVAWTYALDAVLMLPAQVRMLRTAMGLSGAQVFAAVSRPVAAGIAMAAFVVAAGAAIPQFAPLVRILILVPLGAAAYWAALVAIDREGLRHLLEIVRGFLARRRAATQS